MQHIFQQAKKVGIECAANCFANDVEVGVHHTSLIYLANDLSPSTCFKISRISSHTNSNKTTLVNKAVKGRENKKLVKMSMMVKQKFKNVSESIVPGETLMEIQTSHDNN